MRNTLLIYSVMMMLALLTSCEEKHQEAEKLMNEIRNCMDSECYEDALAGVDSLRRTYPDAVKQRKEALLVHQQASLALAQQNLSVVDSTLQVVEKEYERLKPIVERRHNEGVATASELQHFNELRALRDSLQGVFNMECAKIKYIHKRQEEAKDLDANKAKQG